MKTILKSIAVIFLLISFGCSNYDGELQNSSFTEPTLKSQPRLLYPKAARENNISGKTEVIILVSNTGEVDDVQVIKSSGFGVLDSTSIEFSKNLVFNPATAQGNPVSCRVKWSIEYAFSDKVSYVDSYIRQVKELYSLADNPGDSDRNEILNSIFQLHKQFVDNLWDGQNFNAAVARVVLPETSREWRYVWDNYPLTFLLYHDFIQRFPDYDSLSLVELELTRSLEADMKYIQRTSITNPGTFHKNQELLLQIRNFIKGTYPQIKLDETKGIDFNS